VDLLASSTHPWDHFAGESTGKFLQLFLEHRGVAVHPNARPLRLEGDGRVQRVVVNGAGAATVALECDFAIACVGAAVNKDVLRGTPIAAGKAILVNDHCRTNIPDAYAAGDCCAILDPLFGKHRQLGHWDNAQVTGALAGRNMAGANESYRAVNYFFSDVFDLSLGAWGDARQVDRRLMRGVPRVETGDFVEIGVAADGRVAQVLAIGPTGPSGDDHVLRELVARRVRLDGNEERLKDPGYPLSYADWRACP
jgi:3-phenylpropionate/trans-cinnamate dioxygenase ferredoxin reductase subunit